MRQYILNIRTDGSLYLTFGLAIYNNVELTIITMPRSSRTAPPPGKYVAIATDGEGNTYLVEWSIVRPHEHWEACDWDAYTVRPL